MTLKIQLLNHIFSDFNYKGYNISSKLTLIGTRYLISLNLDMIFPLNYGDS